MEYLDFVIDNYIWFLVGGIVLLMTIIGYVAEKTEFGKKTKKSTKKETKAVVQEVEVPVVSEPEEVVETEEKPSENEVEETIEPEEELQSEMVVNEPKEEPMEDLDDIEIKEPISNALETPVSEEAVEESIPAELYAGLDGTPNLYKNDSLVDDEKEEDKFDMDLPNIEELKDDTTESEENVLEDDDIWKF